jgi:hypothetical protein
MATEPQTKTDEFPVPVDLFVGSDPAAASQVAGLLAAPARAARAELTEPDVAQAARGLPEDPPTVSA